MTLISWIEGLREMARIQTEKGAPDLFAFNEDGKRFKVPLWEHGDTNRDEIESYWYMKGQQETCERILVQLRLKE